MFQLNSVLLFSVICSLPVPSRSLVWGAQEREGGLKVTYVSDDVAF